MNGQVVAFIIANGLLLFAIAAPVAYLAVKRRELLLEALFGAVLCFVVQYLLYPLAFGAFMAWIDAFGGVVTEPLLHTLLEIGFTVLFETMCFVAVALIFRKRARFDTALSFGTGYWLFTAILTLAVSVFDALTSVSLVFAGSELEVFASGAQTILMLPFYCCIAVLAARTAAEGHVGSALFALMVGCFWRLLFALPSLTGFAMMLTLGLALLAVLLLTVKVLRLRGPMEQRRAEMEEAERELEALLAAEEAAVGGDGADTAASNEDEDVLPPSTDEADEPSDEGINAPLAEDAPAQSNIVSSTDPELDRLQ